MTPAGLYSGLTSPDDLPSIAIYGPKAPDVAGGAKYIDRTAPAFRESFRVVHVGNGPDAPDPWSFDHVVYHVGNNRHHTGALRAMRHRRGVAIVHEHNLLRWYTRELQQRELPVGEADELARLVDCSLGTTFGGGDALCEALTRDVGLRSELDAGLLDIGVERIFLRHVTACAVHSHHLLNRVSASAPRGVDVRRIPYPVPSEVPLAVARVRAALRFGPHDFVFGVVGLLGRRKRIDSVVEAWRSWRCRPPHAKLLLAGSLADDVVIPSGIRDLVRVDFVEPDDAFDATVYAADCAIQLRYPSIGETSSQMMRALVTGRPVIASAVGEMLELRELGRVEYVRPGGGEVDDLRAAMDELVDASRGARIAGYTVEDSVAAVTSLLLGGG